MLARYAIRRFEHCETWNSIKWFTEDSVRIRAQYAIRRLQHCLTRKHTKRFTTESFCNCGLSVKNIFASIRFEKACNMKHVHSEERLYACLMCIMTFTASSYLKTHLKKNHSQQDLYACSTCDKTFATSSSLQIHERSHGGGTYACLVCNKNFPTLFYLKGQENIPRNERLPACSVCNKTFTTSYSLK